MSIINDVLVDKLFKDPPKRTKEIPLLSEKTVSGDGMVVINDAYSDFPIKNLTLQGNTKQDSTTGKNLFSSNYDEYTLPLNYYIYPLILNKGETYTASIKSVSKIKNIVINILRSGSAYPFENTEIVDVLLNLEDTLGDKKATFTVDETFTTPAIAIYAESKESFNSLFEAKEIQLEKGSIATSYEPYTGGKPSPSPDYPQKIESAGNDGAIGVNVSGKNLIDFDKYYDSFKVGDEFVGKPRDLYEVKIQLPKMFIGKKLTFSALFYHVNEHSNIRCGASIDGKSINGTTSPDINKWFLSKLTFTMVDETDTIYFDYGSSRNVRIKNIMLELGDTVTPYEPYKPLQSLVLQTPNGLPGIPATSDGNYTDENGQQWICDEIDCEKGEYIKRIDCAVLDGVNIKFSDSGPESLFWNGTKNTLHDANQKNIGMSNYLTKGMFAFNSNYDFVFVYKEKALEYFDTVEQFNSFLEQKNAEGNPVKIYYTIENPVKQKLSKKEIEAFKSLHTNYPTTTVLNDAGAWMEMRYLSPAIIPKKEYALRMWFKENPII